MKKLSIWIVLSLAPSILFAKGFELESTRIAKKYVKSDILKLNSNRDSEGELTVKRVRGERYDAYIIAERTELVVKESLEEAVKALLLSPTNFMNPIIKITDYNKVPSSFEKKHYEMIAVSKVSFLVFDMVMHCETDYTVTRLEDNSYEMMSRIKKCKDRYRNETPVQEAYLIQNLVALDDGSTKITIRGLSLNRRYSRFFVKPTMGIIRSVTAKLKQSTFREYSRILNVIE